MKNNVIPPQRIDRAVNNATYMMILLNGGLSDWANKFYANGDGSRLRFVVSQESDSIDDTYLSLSFEENGVEEIIPAGYVGQRLNEKEEAYCKKLPVLRAHDLCKSPPYVTVHRTLKSLKDHTGIVDEIATTYQTILTDTCEIAKSVTAALATANGSAILFLRHEQLYVTKIEFYTKDIIEFIKKIEERRSSAIGSIVRNILTSE